MTTIIGLSGSLREGSFNTALLQTAAELMPEGASLKVETLHGIPLYDADAESRDGLPEAVVALKEKIASADGLILSTPEYNNGIPGVFKNGIDWLSRPPADIGDVFGDTPVALIGATPGGLGTVSAQSAWLPVLRTLGTRPWFGGRLMVSRANTVFDKNGALTDDDLRERLRQFLEGFVDFAAAARK